MEPNMWTTDVGGSDEGQQSMTPVLPAHSPPPAPLREGEVYHVFISYSSIDGRWAQSLINSLEAAGLQVCYHSRDFTPGRAVLENMSDCIQASQKVLLVLSQEFVRSRWCLQEANMSLFRECLERKPVLPVLLEPGVDVPLHLRHLTYLEAWDPDFLGKVLNALCTPNRQLRGTGVVPIQPPSICNGKALQPQVAVNEEGLHSWEAGLFSVMDVPDQLCLVVEDQEKYREAIRIINNVSQTKVWLRPYWLRLLMYFLGVLQIVLLYVLVSFTSSFCREKVPKYLFLFFLVVPLGLTVQLCLWKSDDNKYIIGEMQRAVGKANTLLSGVKVLMGCQSNTKLHVVYTSKSLEGCRREFSDTFPGRPRAAEMFQRALLYFSSGYACCLSKRPFPLSPPTASWREGCASVSMCPSS
ncbi:uncharacterized protein LOC134020780 [Osmerus eperlanus]|uniref:uncharacterized protein LOC134020780 n=1 Tax=Osmerus eperlanus TaxID=29151 RepID=UPI002E1332BB